MSKRRVVEETARKVDSSPMNDGHLPTVPRQKSESMAGFTPKLAIFDL